MRAQGDAPRFSVLIPTLDGRPTLGHAINSVLDQDFSDFELIISDDGSTGDQRELIEEAGRDSRVGIIRPQRRVAGTKLAISENWNAALGASRGRYVMLLGDDDALTRGSLQRLDTLLEGHAEPDCLSFNGYRFLPPDSLPGLSDSMFEELDPYPHPGEFSLTDRRATVRRFYSFDLRYQLGNMHLILVSRNAIAGLSDGLFKPPFPDFYALAALMLRARRWIHVAERHGIVGVSAESVASRYHRGEREDSMGYLGERQDFPDVLPGNPLLNALYLWLLELRSDYPEELSDVRPDRGEYVIRQAWNWYQQKSAGSLSGREFRHRFRLIGARDWLRMPRALIRGRNLRYLAATHRHRRELDSYLFLRAMSPAWGARSVSEFRDRLADSGAPDAAAAGLDRSA